MKGSCANHCESICYEGHTTHLSLCEELFKPTMLCSPWVKQCNIRVCHWALHYMCILGFQRPARDGLFCTLSVKINLNALSLIHNLAHTHSQTTEGSGRYGPEPTS